MRLNLSIFGSLALATTLATGCAPQPVTSTGGSFPTGGNTGSSSDGNSNTDGGVAGTPTDSGVPSNPLNNGAHYSGIYNANAQLDFTQPGVLPGLISPALAALSEVGTDPGDALVTLAKAAGVSIPLGLDSAVGSIITQQLGNVIPADVEQTLQTISNIAQITKTSTLQNSMTIHTPSATGAVQVDIVVNGVGFDFVDINLKQAARRREDVAREPRPRPPRRSPRRCSRTRTHRSPTPTSSSTVARSPLPVGDWVLQAMGPLVFQPEWGTTDLKSTLEKLLMTPCNDLGPIVEDGVMDLTGLDVGSTVGTTICTDGRGPRRERDHRAGREARGQRRQDLERSRHALRRLTHAPHGRPPVGPPRRRQLDLVVRRRRRPGRHRGRQPHGYLELASCGFDEEGPLRRAFFVFGVDSFDFSRGRAKIGN